MLHWVVYVVYTWTTNGNDNDIDKDNDIDNDYDNDNDIDNDNENSESNDRKTTLHTKLEWNERLFFIKQINHTGRRTTA